MSGISKHLLSDIEIDNIETGLLIGYDCPAVFQPDDVIRAPDRSLPHAILTVLGWCIIGSFCEDSSDVLVSNKIICSENTRIQPNFKVKETTPRDILDTLEQDFKEVEEKKGLSQEDKRFLEITSHRHQTDEGRFEIPIPFKKILLH